MDWGDTEPGAETNEEPGSYPSIPLSKSLILISISLALEALLMWIVSVGWVLNVLAGAILLGNVCLGVFVGRLIFKVTKRIAPKWTALTVSIFLGFSVAFAVLELTHSHRLVRDYEHYSSDDDE